MSTPNMNLTPPTVSVTSGPLWATQLNACLDIIDSHDHTAGSGVQITPAAINIDTDLPFGNNNIILARSLRFTSQSSPIAGVADLGCLYVSGDDLYYNDEQGNQIRITQSGSIVSGGGNITGLVAPASASYVALAETFYWESNVNTPANMDLRSIILRNNVVSGFGLTLQAPTLTANYTISLPQLPVGGTKIVTMATSGVMSAITDVDNSTIEISSNNLRVKAGGINTNELANASVTSAKLAVGSFGSKDLYQTPGTFTWVCPSGVTTILVSGRGGSGGGGVGAVGASIGSSAANPAGRGGDGCTTLIGLLTVVPSTSYTVTVGAKGVGGTASAALVASLATAGGDSAFGTLTVFKGGNGGNTAGVSTGGRSIGGAGGALTLPPNNSSAGNGTDGGFAGTGPGGIGPIYLPVGSGAGSIGSGGGGGGGDGPGGNGGQYDNTGGNNVGTSGANGVNGGGGGGASSNLNLPGTISGGDGTDGYVQIFY